MIDKLSYKRCPCMPVLFFRKHKGRLSIVVMHVDGGKFGFSHQNDMDSFIQALQEHVNKVTLSSPLSNWIITESQMLLN